MKMSIFMIYLPSHLFILFIDIISIPIRDILFKLKLFLRLCAKSCLRILLKFHNLKLSDVVSQDKQIDQDLFFYTEIVCGTTKIF